MHDFLIGNDYLKVKSACDELVERDMKIYHGPFIFENSNLNTRVEINSVDKTHGDPTECALHDDNPEFNSEVVISQDQMKSDGNEVIIGKIANVNGFSNEPNIAGCDEIDQNLPEGAVLCDVNVDAPDIEMMSFDSKEKDDLLNVFCDELKSDRLTLGVAAVQTRSQSQNESKPLKPLKLTKFDALNLTVVDFKKMQKADPNLDKYWNLAKDEEFDQTDNTITFVVLDDILYREYSDSARNKVVKQLLIPEQLIDKVIAYAHESLLSGHCSIAKTIGILTQECWFYSMHARVKRWVKSCDMCQR
jgi:Integrase zinc binding domain